MPDFTPNEMDALFREGAERHEFEYNPDSWALMEEKLDNRDRRRRWILFLLGGTLAILGLISIAYLNLSRSETKEAIAEARLEAFENNKASGEKVLTDEAVITTENVELSTTQTTSTKEEKSINQPKSTNEYILSDSKESGDNIGAQNSFLSENTGNLVSNEIVSIASPTTTAEEVPDTKENVTDQLADKSAVGEGIQESIESLVTENRLMQIEKIKSFTIAPFENRFAKFDQLDVVPPNSPEEVLETNNRFALTLFANPEWSSVGLFNESKAGWSFGTRIGYQFADKFEVSMGVAYSRKVYKGGGEAYVMEGGWFNDIEPERMDAKCDVIEIPIAMTYYLNGFQNNGFFADIGINSYMLHSEWYGFQYDDLLVRPDRYKDVNEENANKHLIGVGRVAFGYQHVLSNNTTVQVAPYLQFPLTGIGAGQVNLYSSGVQLAVKFNTQ